MISFLSSESNPHETYAYTAFGEEILFNSAIKLIPYSCNPWRYQSKRKIGPYVYFGRRFYDPETATWLSEDPKGFTDSPNLYQYLVNNPLSHFDLYGEEVLFSNLFKNKAESCFANQDYYSTPNYDRIGRYTANTFSNTWNSPRFQGSMQAFGGAIEAGIEAGARIDKTITNFT